MVGRGRDRKGTHAIIILAGILEGKIERVKKADVRTAIFELDDVQQ